ncbi:MAG: chorismate-binding protein [Planctomycetota bacterium]|nr:chorismate-binding protein [Planctomycetota bacterium]MDA1113917.1 chorismate-binding protein [Planctomycetota bacterium]
MDSTLRNSTSADAERYRLTWLERPSDLHTPVRLFLALRSRGHQVCLLESAEGPDRIARYSFLALDPVEKFTATNGQAHRQLQELADRARTPKPPLFLPPFRGGWIGYLPYEWATQLEDCVPRAAQDPWALPVAEFHLFETVLAFDHAAQRLILMTSCKQAEDFEASMAALDTLVEEIETSHPAVDGFQLLGDGPTSNMDRATFEAGAAKLQEAIAEGEIFQAVLSQRFDQKFTGDPFALYRALRLTNPSPHMFYFEASGITLVGSSPERLVSVKAGRVENRPIAGTRARGADETEDDRLGAELLADIKEKAEHAMLVDLARNDLGRVARFGTVEVKENMALEKFARVQHLASRVECDLASSHVPMDALAASFPAGTVSGAPKIRAMQLIAEIEQETRGPYAGAFGYLDSSGNLDMAITIRTFVVRGDTVSVQAGAGIVFDSRPEREYQETLEKADALFMALRLAGSHAFTPASAEVAK